MTVLKITVRPARVNGQRTFEWAVVLRGQRRIATGNSDSVHDAWCDAAQWVRDQQLNTLVQ